MNAKDKQPQPETRTLQLWPGGPSVTYRGEYPDYQVRGGTRWHKASRDAARDIRMEELARAYSERDILCCDSSLVNDARRYHYDMPLEFGQEWEDSEIVNLYPDPSDWSFERCREWVEENTSPVLAPTEGIPDEDDDDALEAYRDAVRDNAEPAEIFEWWRVTQWLARQLKATGECVLENAYGTWWGRCTTGQSYRMDGVLQRVARRFVD